jgi:hypothetical protein
LLLGLPGFVAAADSAFLPSGEHGELTASSLRDSSDEDLTAMAARWDSLGKHERRVLLTEMKARMARQGGPSSTLRIRTERRYGRIIRQADGRVIRIETQVVHVRPASPDELTAARQAFGVGFEQRVGSRAGPFGADGLMAGDGTGEVRLPLTEMMEAVEAAIRLQPPPVMPAALPSH